MDNGIQGEFHLRLWTTQAAAGDSFETPKRAQPCSCRAATCLHHTQHSAACKRAAMAPLGTTKRALAQMREVLLAGLTCEEGGRACAQATCGASVSSGALPCSHHNSSCLRGVMSPGSNPARYTEIRIHGMNVRCQFPSTEQPQQRRQPGQQAWSIQQSNQHKHLRPGQPRQAAGTPVALAFKKHGGVSGGMGISA